MLELKHYLVRISETIGGYSQSHHAGIETCSKVSESPHDGNTPNRTMLELKHGRGQSPRGLRNAPNRTMLELKRCPV